MASADVERVHERAPVLGRRDRRIDGAVTPGGCVQHPARAGVDRACRPFHLRARRPPPLVSGAVRENIHPRLAGHRNTLVRECESGLEAASHRVRRRREDADPARGPPVHARQHPPGDPGARHPVEGVWQTKRLRRVEPDALERNAVPQLDDERPRHGVPVHVAEAVRDHDDPRPSGAPEAPQRMLRYGRDAAHGGIRELAR